jgi:hypothetical protein
MLKALSGVEGLAGDCFLGIARKRASYNLSGYGYGAEGFAFDPVLGQDDVAKTN